MFHTYIFVKVFYIFVVDGFFYVIEDIGEIVVKTVLNNVDHDLNLNFIILNFKPLKLVIFKKIYHDIE